MLIFLIQSEPSCFNRNVKREEIDSLEFETKSKTPRIESIEINDIFEIVQSSRNSLKTATPRLSIKEEKNSSDNACERFKLK